jgi:hypothetical protein
VGLPFIDGDMVLGFCSGDPVVVFVVLVVLLLVPVEDWSVGVAVSALPSLPAMIDAAGAAVRTSPGPGLTPICGTKTPVEGVGIAVGTGVGVPV